MIERIYLRSGTRRGRLRTSPNWRVWFPDGTRLTFMRRRDARAFLAIWNVLRVGGLK